MKNKIITITLLLLMIINISSCKKKIVNENVEVPLTEIEDVEPEPDNRPHFPLEDIIYEYEKIVDPETDPKAKRLYDAHGGGTVVIDHNGYYSIINYDVSAADFTDTAYKPDVYSEGSRKSVEHWESINNLLNNITFRGTPTGRTVQKVGYYVGDEQIDEHGGVTYVEFLVKEAYYGRVRPGDYIWICDSFAIGLKDGKMQIVDSSECSGYIFLGMDYLVAGDLWENGHYTVPTAFKALRLDVEYTPTTDTNDGIDYARYKKYILDKDIKLCKEQEYERFAILNFNKYYNETFTEHQGRPNFTYSDPRFAPTDEQKQIVDEQIQFYGERETRWTEQSDFKFSLTFGIEGTSSYDSQSGTLIRTKHSQNINDYTATMFLKEDKLNEIKQIIDGLDIGAYPDKYDPLNDPESDIITTSSPSRTIILTVTTPQLTKTVDCTNIAIGGEGYDDKARAFLEAIDKITDIITSTDEWKAFPELDFAFG